MKISRTGIRRGAALLAAWLLTMGWTGAVYGEETPTEPRQSTEEAEEIRIEERGLTLGESALTYPAVTGLPEELGKAVNDRLLEDTRVPDYLTRMSQLISGGSLRVSWTGGLLGDVLSCAVSAEGAVETPRPTHVWTWSNIDLRDGREIRMDDLFADPEGAREEMARILEEEIAPELSAHLGHSGLLPLPEGFRMERTGLTLLYPAEQLSTLSDRAGAVKIGWHRLASWLDLTEDGICARIGVPEMIELTAESRDRLAEMTASGRLTDVPAEIGEALAPLTETHHLLMDPEVYEGGRLFALEGAGFQQILLTTDYLREAWDGSVVQGMRAAAGCYWGLCIGKTAREAWISALGEPDSRVALDAEQAERWRAEPGSCDYYRFGAYQLQLFADAEGVLRMAAVTGG